MGEREREGTRTFFFCYPLFSFLSRNVDLCQRFFRLTLFQRSFNWRLSPISTPELAQSVFPLPSPSSQLVEVFSLASRGRGWARESLPRFQQCPRNVLVRYMPPVFLEDPLGICQIVSSKSGAFLSRVLSWL